MSLDEPNAITFSISSGVLFLVSTVSDTSKLQFVPSIRPQNKWCQAMALLSLVSLATKMSVSKLIYYFSSHPAAFWFWSLSPPDNITLNAANKRADQSLLELLTDIGTAAHATLDTEQLISHTRIAFIDTISSLQDFEGGVNSVSEVHELLTNILDIVDNAVSKWVCNTAHISEHVFNSASRQCHGVWASQFPFLRSLKDTVPPCEACFYGCINWCLAQAQQQSSMGLSLSLPPVRDDKARPKTRPHFNVQSPLCLSGGASLAKRLHLESKTEALQGGRKSTGGSVSDSSTASRKKENHGDCAPDVLHPRLHHPLFPLLFCRLVHLPIFGSKEELYFQQIFAQYG